MTIEIKISPSNTGRLARIEVSPGGAEFLKQVLLTRFCMDSASM